MTKIRYANAGACTSTQIVVCEDSKVCWIRGGTPVQFCGGLLGEPGAPQQLPIKLPFQQQLLLALLPLRQILPAPGPASVPGQ